MKYGMFRPLDQPQYHRLIRFVIGNSLIHPPQFQVKNWRIIANPKTSFNQINQSFTKKTFSLPCSEHSTLHPAKFRLRNLS